MSACVAGITCLQLYWNYQNYKVSVKTFKHDINVALTTAADRELEQRQQLIINTFKRWLADTAFITIKCDVKNTDSSTVFYVSDTHPYLENRRPFSFGITDFKEKLHHITPEAKAMFINHFGNNLFKGHLEQGIIYFYTRRLGDSLGYIYNHMPRNMAAINKIYKQELLERDIDAPFILNPAKASWQMPFLTQKVNTAIKRPYVKEMVFAGFESPSSYFFRQMKWLLVSSLLLIGITIFCFGYTVKTILTQQKLAVLKNDFVNNMTHELKTPIATINIAAEAIKDFNLSRASAHEYLDIIKYQAGNLTNLVDQILKNVASEQESVALNLGETNIEKLIGGIVKEFKPQAAAANVTVNYDSGDSTTTLADEGLLKTAIANLLDNAIKYGGQNAIVNIDQYTQGENIFITVTDNGPGIPQQYQDKVFDRFFRVPSGNLHNVKGYGLGLSYALSIILRHKGSLSLISNPGEGTQFIINIPLIYHEAGQSTVA